MNNLIDPPKKVDLVCGEKYKVKGAIVGLLTGTLTSLVLFMIFESYFVFSLPVIFAFFGYHAKRLERVNNPPSNVLW